MKKSKASASAASKPEPKTIDASKWLWVEILPAKDPNKVPFFPKWMTDNLRFLRYSQPVACMECGKKKKILWTMLCEFRATDTKKCMFVLKPGKLLPPLSPVCDDHPLAPGPGEES